MPPMNAQTPGKLSKFQRYRASKKAQGLKEVRMWVRDPMSPQVKAEIVAFAQYQRHATEEREIMTFIEAASVDALTDSPPD
jgi:hypothetical protein